MNETDSQNSCLPIETNPRLLERLLTAGPQLVAVIDKDGGCRYVSEAVQEVLGVKNDQMVGQNLISFVHYDDAGLLKAALKEVVEAEDECERQLDCRTRKTDDSFCTLRFRLQNGLDEVDCPPGVLVSAHDVSEVKELEAQLRQSQKMVALGQLASGIAHDFNNLLTVIINNAGFAVDEVAEHDAGLKKDLEEILYASRRAGSLVGQLLAFSRNKLLDFRLLDLNDLLDSTVSMLKRIVSEDIRLTVEQSHDIGKIQGDSTQIEQVLVNLVVNACDAMPTGGELRIASSLKSLDSGEVQGLAKGPYVVLQVSDTGVGMPEHVRQRIFEPFFTTKQTGKGTGLGLSTVFGILSHHGAKMTVESAPGEGSTFSIFFPSA